MKQDIDNFLIETKQALNNNMFVKILINKHRSKTSDLNKILIRLVEISSEVKLSFLYNYKTKDITKNYSFDDAYTEIQKYLGVDFKNGILYTIEKDIVIQYSKKMKPSIIVNKATYTELLNKQHDKKKKKYIEIKNNKYLQSLGVINSNGEIAKNMHDKFKQINKYVETIDGIINASNLKGKSNLRIVDMGSGKGYLTFAIYDYLVNTLKINASVTGVEMRPELVELCNKIAKENSFNELNFTEGTIENYKSDKVDILIALHACDTATDDAIYKGISSDAEIIITAPCCHKQVRKQFNVDNEFSEIVKFGILEERQAEIVTDTIRSLMLEANQYKTQVFEFIADAHTHKNVMIVGSKSKKQSDKETYLAKIKNLKSVFGIKYHYLEKLFDK